MLFEGEGLFNPSVDMKEEKDKYIINVEMPGMEKSAINVSVEGQQLLISGEKKTESEEKEEGKYHRRERSYGYFKRAIQLPSNADENAINAEYKQGVLSIVIHKMAAAKGSLSEKKKITIN